MKTKSFANIDEITLYVQKEIKKIATDKLQGMNMEQFKASIIKAKSDENYLDYFDYNALESNISNDLEKYSYVVKKEAIFKYCKTGSSASCASVNSVKKDLDSFESRRVEIEKWP